MHEWLDGKLVGFDGRAVSHARELPPGLHDFNEWNHDGLLPTEAIHRGFNLSEFQPRRAADPYVLYDRWGHILYQWPDNYRPSLTEVFKVCQQIGN